MAIANRRLDFLRKYVEKAKGNVAAGVSPTEVADELNLAPQEAEAFEAYWKSKGHLEELTSSKVNITASALEFIEDIEQHKLTQDYQLSLPVYLHILSPTSEQMDDMGAITVARLPCVGEYIVRNSQRHYVVTNVVHCANTTADCIAEIYVVADSGDDLTKLPTVRPVWKPQ